MKIVITSKLPYNFSDVFSNYRISINDSEETLPDMRLRQMCTDADGLICTLADKIDRAFIEAAPKLKVIVNYATGYDNIDIDYAKHRGITVCNTPNILTQSTAELGFALMLATSRRIVESDKFMRDIKFTGAKPTLMMGLPLYKKTLGIYGMGKIGQAVAKMASGFSMDIIYHNNNRNEQAELLLGATYASFEELLSWSDYIMITAPLTPDTTHRFTAKEFSQMKKNAILINIGRGAIIRESDLAAALKDKVIFGAGLDVYEYEPSVNSSLLECRNAVLTPHIGSATLDTRVEMAKMCANSILSVLRDGATPPNAITRIEKSFI